MSELGALENRRSVVWVVDDDFDVGCGYVASLEEEYEAKFLSSPAEVLDLAAQGVSPDILISDLFMPELDGVSLFQRMQNTVSPRSVRCILTSGRADKADAFRAIESNVFAFLEKPFTVKKLRETIRSAENAIEEESAAERELFLAREKAALFERLSKIYFDRVVLVENILFASQSDRLFGDLKQMSTYLSNIAQSRQICSRIDELARSSKSVERTLPAMNGKSDHE